jgi:hypothetical protein
MDIIPILSTVILSTTFATLVLAVGSYLAFKLRDKRKPAAKPAAASAPPKQFFLRYRPPAGPEDREVV